MVNGDGDSRSLQVQADSWLKLVAKSEGWQLVSVELGMSNKQVNSAVVLPW